MRRAEREVFTLCVWEGLDTAEAAEALGVTAGTVRVRLSRARKRLRALTDAERARMPAAARHPSVGVPTLARHPERTGAQWTSARRRQDDDPGAAPLDRVRQTGRVAARPGDPALNPERRRVLRQHLMREIGRKRAAAPGSPRGRRLVVWAAAPLALAATVVTGTVVVTGLRGGHEVGQSRARSRRRSAGRR